MRRDLGVTAELHAMLPEWAIEFVAALALLGDLVVILPVLGLVCLADARRTVRRRRDGAHAGTLCSARTAVLVALVFGGMALVVLVKSSFALPRTPEAWHAVSPSEHGFPSGHAMAATIFWGALAWWSEPDTRRVRLVAAGTIVAVVGTTRLLLGVHYLVDVVVSVVLGVAFLLVVTRVARDRPARAFAVAIAIGVAAFVVSGASSRGIAALVGTVGAGVGWWLLERPPVRRWMDRAVNRVAQG